MQPSQGTAGLIYKDFKVGEGTPPEDGEQVTFQYTAYNESGRLIDTTYRQDRPAETRLGINGLIPGACDMCSVLCWAHCSAYHMYKAHASC